MTGFEIYNLCRKLQKRRVLTLDQYLNCSEYGFYEMLSSWSVGTKNYSTTELRDYISVVYNYDTELFNPYSLMDQKWEEIYTEWRKTNSTKELYFDVVRRSFDFITNFCIKNNISFDKYKQDWAIRHIRDKKIDGAVAVYLKLVDKKSLSKVQRILLKKFLTEYNIIVVRITNQELNNILASSTQDMKRILDVHASMNSLESKQK